jgi:hypothetical protein
MIKPSFTSIQQLKSILSYNRFQRGMLPRGFAERASATLAKGTVMCPCKSRDLSLKLQCLR